MHPKLENKGAVVTGAAHGIGRAIATRLVAEGARVVINDLDESALAATAAEVGAIPVAGDCGSVDGVTSLIDRASDHLGRIDVFCANAGIDRTAAVSLETSEEDWARVLETNVMSHIRTARALVPRWTADGQGGRLVVTASAASLLTMIGSAPYSVSKHASLGFAEWLAVTYGDHGVTVQAICPQSVQTRMLDAAGPLSDLTPDRALSPDEVADVWITSLDDDRFLVLPHPEVADYYLARATDTDRWLRGMRRLQAKVDAAVTAGALDDSHVGG